MASLTSSGPMLAAMILENRRSEKSAEVNAGQYWQVPTRRFASCDRSMIDVVLVEAKPATGRSGPRPCIEAPGLELQCVSVARCSLVHRRAVGFGHRGQPGIYCLRKVNVHYGLISSAGGVFTRTHQRRLIRGVRGRWCGSSVCCPRGLPLLGACCPRFPRPTVCAYEGTRRCRPGRDPRP